VVPILIIWRGRGLIVLGIIVAAVLIGYFVGNLLHLDGRPANVLIPLSLIPGGVATWLLGKRVNRPSVYHDFLTGQDTMVPNSAHEFFFIRVEKWGVILVVLGAIWALYLAVRTPTGL
jgi:hypothetical protein